MTKHVHARPSSEYKQQSAGMLNMHNSLKCEELCKGMSSMQTAKTVYQYVHATGRLQLSRLMLCPHSVTLVSLKLFQAVVFCTSMLGHNLTGEQQARWTNDHEIWYLCRS